VRPLFSTAARAHLCAYVSGLAVWIDFLRNIRTTRSTVLLSAVEQWTDRKLCRAVRQTCCYWSSAVVLIRAEGDELCTGVTCRRESSEWGALYVAVRFRRVKFDDCGGCWLVNVRLTSYHGRRLADEFQSSIVVTGFIEAAAISSRSLPFLTSAIDPCCCIYCCISVCYFSCRCFFSFQLALLYIAITYTGTLFVYTNV